MGAGMLFVILAAMFFCHICDDYYLQGILANMKQKSWWEKNAPQSMYNEDYLIALITHAFSWSFSISIPLLIAAIVRGAKDTGFLTIVGFYFLNTVIHAFIDNLKANKRAINLIADQSVHGLQVFTTWLVVTMMI